MTIYKLGEYVKIKTGKLNANAAVENGQYPFFTCAVKTYRIDKYSFDCECVLVAGNGELNVKYYKGKFDAYQRTYVIESTNKDFLSTKYLYYFLSKYIEELRIGAIGGVIKYIKLSHLTDIEIPVPDIETQHQIVATLERADSLVDKRKRSIELLNELLNATFLKMFDSYLINEIDEHLKLGEISNIVSGITKGRKTKDTVLVEVPYLRVANVQDNFFDLSEIKTIPATKKEIEKYKLEKNDLLLTEGGDPDKLGRGCIWDSKIDNLIYQNHLFRVRIINKEEYNPIFLNALIGSGFGKQYFLKAAKQTTGIATINSRQLKAFPVPKIPFALQKKFAIKSQVVVAISDRVKEKIMPKTEELFQSLLQRAFHGDLLVDEDLQLDNFLESEDHEAIAKDEVLIQKLIDRFNSHNDTKNEKDKDENDFSFESLEVYEKAKEALFYLLKSGKAEQTFDKALNQTTLKVT